MGATRSRVEYEELVCRGRPDEYPKRTEEAVTDFRAMDYDVRVPTLDYLIRKGTVHPDRTGRNYEWYQKHIDKAAAELEAQELFTPRAWGNIDLGVSAAQRIRALREAVCTAIDEFEAEVPEDETWFDMIVHPPRMSRDGWVEFRLADDMRAYLEQRRSELRTADLQPDHDPRRKGLAEEQDEVSTATRDSQTGSATFCLLSRPMLTSNLGPPAAGQPDSVQMRAIALSFSSLK